MASASSQSALILIWFLRQSTARGGFCITRDGSQPENSASLRCKHSLHRTLRWFFWRLRENS
jgi:hypothetical protein